MSQQVNEISTAVQESAEALALRGFRERFPITERIAYFDVSARGPLAADVSAALHQYIETRMLEGGDKPAMFEMADRARRGFARLVHADESEIALTKNVSEGINAIVAAFDWRPGDKIVYCPELEHPNNVYPWLHIARRAGVELVAVPPVDGRIDASRICEAIDARTRLVSVSTATFAPGLLTPVAEIGAACRAAGVFLLVDAVQSVGIVATDVDQLGVDGLSVSTQKGLLALYGMGFLYCRRAWAAQLEPAYLARFSVDLGDQHEAALGDLDYRLMPGARRFEVGNYNYIGAVAAGTSIDAILEIGPQVIERHVRGLSAELAEGLAALGLPVLGPLRGPERGSIVCVGQLGDGGHDTVDDESLASLHQHWQDNDVRLSIRRGLLRLSLHAYNDRGDIERTVELARDWLRRA